MGRPKTPLLSMQRIADAAMELIESGAQFSVNGLARRLGVNPSSLYHHVSGREEIIGLVRVRLAERYALDDSRSDWLEFIEYALRTQRRMYAEHPGLIPLIIETTITDETTIRWYDRLVSRIAAAGIPEQERLAIVAIVDAFAIGFGLDLASPDNVWTPGQDTTALAGAIEAAPRGRERADQAFDLGLELLLSSLRARYTRGNG